MKALITTRFAVQAAVSFRSDHSYETFCRLSNVHKFMPNRRRQKPRWAKRKMVAFKYGAPQAFVASYDPQSAYIATPNETPKTRKRMPQGLEAKLSIPT